MDFEKSWIASARPYLEQHARPDLAPGMSAYMKNRFPFYGIQSVPRGMLFKRLQKDLGYPDFDLASKLIPALMAQPEREWHYLALDIAIKKKLYNHSNALQLFEDCVEQNTWWDTVDTMAVHCFGKHLLVFPEKIPDTIERYTCHENFWYQRLGLLYCLKYKEKTNWDLLQWSITALASSREFFVQKGMGWVLREKSKTNPGWVKHVLEVVPVSNLTRKEASKYLP